MAQALSSVYFGQLLRSDDRLEEEGGEGKKKSKGKINKIKNRNTKILLKAVHVSANRAILANQCPLNKIRSKLARKD